MKEHQALIPPVTSTNFISRLLTHDRLPFAVALVAIILTLPSLNAGLLLDDYHHKLLMTGSESPVRLLESPLDMFNFLNSGPQRIAELRDFGFVPWWTSDNVKIGFWRPLTSLTHWLDYVLWPRTPAMMHAHNLLWYGAVALAAAFLYRRLAPTSLIAGLAALLFAIDDAHGTPAGFIANRNALMATFFGVLAIIAHDRWRRDNWRRGIVWAPLLLALSLLSAEFGISTCAYLAAYALFIDQAQPRQRLVTLVPYVAIVLIWRLLWTHLGYGVENTSIYVDPLRDSLEFLNAVKTRAPLLLLGQWAMPPSDLAIALYPKMAAMLWYMAVCFLGLLAFVLSPLICTGRKARFWATAMILSILPVCTTFPQDRLLLFVGIGAMGLLAQMLATVLIKHQSRPKMLCWRIPAVSLAIGFVLIHVVLAPFALAIRSAQPMGPKKMMNRLMVGTLDQAVRNQDLVLVNPPVASMVESLEWEGENQPVPRYLRILTSSLFEPVELRRPDVNTLIVRPRYGYYAWLMDAMWHDKKHSFSAGDRVELTGMTVEIKEVTGDGRPTEAAFRFPVPLEDPSLRWLQYKDNCFTKFIPPRVGESIILPGASLSWR